MNKKIKGQKKSMKKRALSKNHLLTSTYRGVANLSGNMGLPAPLLLRGHRGACLAPQP